MNYTKHAVLAKAGLCAWCLMLAMTSPALAQQQAQQNTYAASWAIVLFCVRLGLIGALRPSARKTEIKKTTTPGGS